MVQEKTFRRVIAENPGADAPRLVYADWLEEHGQSARAELIRVQCQLARLKRGQRGRGRLRQRERILLADHRLELLGEIAEFVRLAGERIVHEPGERYWLLGAGKTTVEFHRGLIERVEIPAHRFATQAEALFRTCFVRELQIDTDTFRVSAPARLSTIGRILAAKLHDTRLRVLRLHGLAVTPPSLRALTRIVGLTNLESLDLSHCSMGDAAVAALVASPKFERLTELALEHNQLSDAGLYRVARARTLRSLQTLRISDCWSMEPYSLAGLIALVESPRLPSLRVIHVDHRIGPLQVDFIRDRYAGRVRVTRDENNIPF